MERLPDLQDVRGGARTAAILTANKRRALAEIRLEEAQWAYQRAVETPAELDPATLVRAS